MSYGGYTQIWVNKNVSLKTCLETDKLHLHFDQNLCSFGVYWRQMGRQTSFEQSQLRGTLISIFYPSHRNSSLYYEDVRKIITDKTYIVPRQSAKMLKFSFNTHIYRIIINLIALRFWIQLLARSWPSYSYK